MIIIKGDVLDVEVGIIAHGVNCQRTMGSGIAKQIRDRFPIVYDFYRLYGPSGPDALGLVSLIPIDQKLFIANCYTQVFYGSHKPYGNNYIHFDHPSFTKCLIQLLQHSKVLKIPLCMPWIGCGLAGATKESVESIIRLMERLSDQEIIIYENS